MLKMSHKTPISAYPAGPTVHELQDLAREAARSRPRRRRPVSRAARLHLIDILSRWGGAGLAMIAGTAVFVAVTAGVAYPLRVAVWAILTLTALHVCRELRKRFRAGDRISARPFRWRANYTAALSALSGAFGAGALIVLPAGAPSAVAIQAVALMLVTALGAGLAHAAHGRAAAAATLPATAFLFLAAWRTAGLGPAALGFAAAAATGAGALFLFHRYLRQRAVSRFPRTGYVRMDARRQDRTAPAEENAAAFKAQSIR